MEKKEPKAALRSKGRVLVIEKAEKLENFLGLMNILEDCGYECTFCLHVLSSLFISFVLCFTIHAS